jgi:hypothetical protein
VVYLIKLNFLNYCLQVMLELVVVPVVLPEVQELVQWLELRE